MWSLNIGICIVTHMIMKKMGRSKKLRHTKRKPKGSSKDRRCNAVYISLSLLGSFLLVEVKFCIAKPVRSLLKAVGNKITPLLPCTLMLYWLNALWIALLMSTVCSRGVSELGVSSSSLPLNYVFPFDPKLTSLYHRSKPLKGPRRNTWWKEPKLVEKTIRACFPIVETVLQHV
jgi:hypothetical protein